MTKRPLPYLGKIGFGIAGPHGSKLVLPTKTEQLIEHAARGGIRYFDTAPSYGGGEAERRLGLALRKFPNDQVFISTKAGLDESKTRDFSPTAILKSLQRSVGRLQLPKVDCLFLHGPGASEMTREFFSEIQKIKEDGLFDFLGMAGRGSELDAAIKSKQFDFLMMPMGKSDCTANLARARKFQKSGGQVIGIEMLSHTKSVWKMPKSGGDIWYIARALLRGTTGSNNEPALRALQQALRLREADIVLSSTIRDNHVQDWLECLDELRGNP